MGVAVVMASYLEVEEANLPLPSLRLATSILLDKTDILLAGNVLSEICNEVFS